MNKLSLEEACSVIIEANKAFSSSGRGSLIFVGAERTRDVQNLAIKVAQKLSIGKPMPIYVVQGNMRGEYSWSFSRIKNHPRLRLQEDGEIIAEARTLIFPQDRQVILLAEYFDLFDPNDQRAYSHLVGGEGGPYALYEGSILIGSLLSTDPGQLELGSSSRGMHLDLACE